LPIVELVSRLNTKREEDLQNPVKNPTWSRILSPQIGSCRIDRGENGKIQRARSSATFEEIRPTTYMISYTINIFYIARSRN
jgi:hypothetical protein